MANESSVQIVVADHDPVRASSLALMLESEFSAVVTECADPDSAVDFISMLDSVDLVVVADTEVFTKLAHSLTTSEGKYKSILCVEKAEEQKKLLMSRGVLDVISKVSILDPIKKLVEQHLFSGTPLSAGQASDYIKIKMDVLVQVSPVPSSVYLSLSPTKYIRVLAAGDKFDRFDMDRFIKEKRVEYLYVKRSESQLFLESLKKKVEDLASAKTTDPVSITQVSKHLTESAHHLVLEAGMTPEVKMMAEANTKMILKSISTKPQLGNLMDRFKKERGQYIPVHSMFLSEIACAIASDTSWNSEFTYQKLILASMFHDLTIRHHDLAKINKLDDLKERKDLLLLDKYEDFVQHPIKASKLVNEMANVVPDVEGIVAQHHELPDGSGFPRKLGAQNIVPLAAVFIIAHDFVDYAYAQEDATDLMKRFLEAKREAYGSSNFRKVWLNLYAKHVKGEEPKN